MKNIVGTIEISGRGNLTGMLPSLRSVFPARVPVDVMISMPKRMLVIPIMFIHGLPFLTWKQFAPLALR
ncbi:MAG: hypothetical protein VB957_03400 [Pseudomonadales bacterium]